jgi:polar amino acid transport system substrate-binding protein
MKTLFTAILFSMLILLAGCEKSNSSANEIHFATSAEYPPFEYIEHNQITGFDIELAQLVAKQLGKKAIFDNLQFSTVLPAVTSGQSDAAIATLTVTEARKKNVDFSIPYHFDGMAAVFKKDHPIKNATQITGKKVATQFGSVMDIWLHQNFEADNITAFDNNNQAIEALLGGHVEVVVIDGAQAAVFSKKHPELAYAIIQQAKEGYAIAVKKGSPLLPQINHALQQLIATGELNKLKTKWLGTAI